MERGHEAAGEGGGQEEGMSSSSRGFSGSLGLRELFASSN